MSTGSISVEQNPKRLRNYFENFDGKKLDELEEQCLIELSRRDLKWFLRYVMRDEQGKDWNEIADFQEEWCELSEGSKHLNVEGPKKFAKSSTLSVGRTIWKLGKNIEHLVKIVSANDTEASKRGASVLRNIQENEKIHKVFPHLKVREKEPSISSFIIADRKGLSGEPSVQCYGVFSGSTGGMANEIILDDVVDMRNSLLMPALREKVKDTVYDNWIPMLLPGGKAINLSNAWHVADLTQGLKSNPNWVTWSKPVVIAVCKRCGKWQPFDPPLEGEYDVPACDACEYPKTEVRSLWPDKWNMEQLLELKKGTRPRTWTRLYMLDAASDEEAEFSREKLEECSRPVAWPGRDGAVYVAGVDLAMSKGPKGAYFVCLRACICPDGSKHLTGMFRRRGVPFHRQADEVVRAWQETGAEDLKVEDNGYQSALVQELERRSEEDSIDGDSVRNFRGRLPVSSYTTTAISKRDLELGMPGLSSEISRGEWTIWDSDGALRHLVQEAKLYPNGDHTDTVMAWLFVRAALRRYEPKKGQAAKPIATSRSGKFSRHYRPRFKTSPFRRPVR